MKPLVAGNWKMNGDLESLSELTRGIASSLNDSPLDCEILVFPSYVYLGEIAGLVQGSALGLGAQDLDVREGGAVTGAVSGNMLKDVGCSYVLVGHSERRTLFGESDQAVADKFAAALAAGLTPIVCVGESLDERKAGQAISVVTRQLQAVTDHVSVDDLRKGHVAYEPVWAIGTGESATPEQAEEVHAELAGFLRQVDAGLSKEIKILYGGSVTPDNAASLFAKQHIDGALVGGASLKTDSFIEICQAAQASAA